MSRSAKTLMVVIAAALMSACGSAHLVDSSRAQVIIPPQVYSEPAAGTIYSSGTDMRLFEDRKANRVGDILTVVLAEQTNATKNSQTSTSKATETSLTNPTVFGTPVNTQRHTII